MRKTEGSRFAEVQTCCLLFFLASVRIGGIGTSDRSRTGLPRPLIQPSSEYFNLRAAGDVLLVAAAVGRAEDDPEAVHDGVDADVLRAGRVLQADPVALVCGVKPEGDALHAVVGMEGVLILLIAVVDHNVVDILLFRDVDVDALVRAIVGFALR